MDRLAGFVDGVAVAVETDRLLLVGEAVRVFCGVVAVDVVGVVLLRLNVVLVWLLGLVVFGLRGIVVVGPEGGANRVIIDRCESYPVRRGADETTYPYPFSSYPSSDMWDPRSLSGSLSVSDSLSVSGSLSLLASLSVPWSLTSSGAEDGGEDV